MELAKVLEQENTQLKGLLLQQEDAIICKDRELANQAQQISLLKEFIAELRQRQFGTSSEKQNVDQLGLFNEAEVVEQSTEAVEAKPETVEVTSHTRQKRPRISIPDDLPREVIEYDLPEAEKVCPHDGTALKRIGSDQHEQLDIIPTQIKVIQHQRLKYACPCCEQYVVTAKKPKQAIEKSIASPGLLAYVAVSKYCDALPLHRQSEIFNRIGTTLDRANLANWMMKVGELAQPLINLIQEQLLEQDCLHMDETPVQVLNEPGKRAQSKSYMWLMAAFAKQPAVLFQYDPSRSQQVPQVMLDDYAGALMVDGYEGYQRICQQNGIQRLGCWAHARRKFVDAQKLQKQGKTGKADQGIAYFQALYQIEKAIKDKPHDERYDIRQQRAKPIIDKIKKWLEKKKLAQCAAENNHRQSLTLSPQPMAATYRLFGERCISY